MKKTFIAILAAAAMVGCIKREVVEPTAGELGSATIKGKVMVNTDFSNDTTNWETDIPASLKTKWENGKSVQVTLKYWSGDLDETNNQSGEYRTITTMTDATTGAYSFTVQTPKTGDINYDITFQDDVRVDGKVFLDSNASSGGMVTPLMVTVSPYSSIEQVEYDFYTTTNWYRNECGDINTNNCCGYYTYLGFYNSFDDFYALILSECNGSVNSNYTVKNGDVKTHNDIYYSSQDYHDVVPPTGSL